MTSHGSRLLPPTLPELDPALDPADDTVADDDGLIVERPDGYYWVAPVGKEEYGPFETPELARLDRDMSGDDAPEPGETLQEAESEIGIADWVDPETGEPAEGLGRPHLDAE